MYDDRKPPKKLGQSASAKKREREQEQRIKDLRENYAAVPVDIPKYRFEKRGNPNLEIVHTRLPSDMMLMMRAEARNKDETLATFLEQAISDWLRHKGYGPLLDGSKPIPDDLRILGQKHPGLTGNPGRPKGTSKKAKADVQQLQVDTIAMMQKRKALEGLHPTWRDGVLCKPGFTMNDVVKDWRWMTDAEIEELKAFDMIPPKP